MKCVRALAALVCLVACAAPVSAHTQSAVEYYHAGWNYYFVTSFPAEIATLDGGAFGGVWKRTGQTFSVWSTAEAGTAEVCRFFSTSFAPRSSHFYTPFATECEDVKNNADWQYEAVSFRLKTPDASASCPAGSAPLYRLYNEGAGGAPNHRYTASRTIVADMRALGWTSEGIGADVVFACVPASSAGTAEGVWVGTTTANESVRGVILGDGTYYLVYSNPGNATERAVLHGSATAAGGQFASPGLDYPIPLAGETDDVATPASLSGTYTPRSALQLTITDSRGARTLNASYVAGSDQPASLDALAGSYIGRSGHVDGSLGATFTIDANGNFVGRNNVCGFVGTVTPRTTINAFDLSLTSSGALCIFGAGPVAGVLLYDEAARRIRYFAPLYGGGDMYFVIGTK